MPDLKAVLAVTDEQAEMLLRGLSIYVLMIPDRLDGEWIHTFRIVSEGRDKLREAVAQHNGGSE